MPPSVVYLLGYLGVGKYTLARQLVRRTGACLVDNQLINTPIFSVLNWDGSSQLPATVWERIRSIRDLVLATIEDSAPPSLGYVLTNVLEDTDQDIALYDRIEAIAARRGSHFVPVLVIYDLEEHVRRVVSAERTERFKWSDAEAVRA